MERFIVVEIIGMKGIHVETILMIATWLKQNIIKDVLDLWLRSGYFLELP